MKNWYRRLACLWTSKKRTKSLKSNLSNLIPKDPCSHWPRSLFSLELYETHIARFQQTLKKQEGRSIFAVPVKPTRIYYVQGDLKRSADGEVDSVVPTKKARRTENKSES
ncbi:hypothetical protein E1B28_005521 [Marasmius oreades]|uniref:Uncharacterized protein n=1 Tax=Marasmius oreades TaxID=181124 RepID=A0A9P7S416_9AGAR|nr:uncharacterized protein E1B28_005521 [Marasmius oreades]KAG7094702.1 hypothetical protein E1B28_005521 [Marasmius oreades]